jgi:hypothetical protein
MPPIREPLPTKSAIALVIKLILGTWATFGKLVTRVGAQKAALQAANPNKQKPIPAGIRSRRCR